MTANIEHLERAVLVTEQQAKEMRHSLDLYKSDPAKYAPQLDNLVSAARQSAKILVRFVLDTTRFAADP